MIEFLVIGLTIALALVLWKLKLDCADNSTRRGARVILASILLILWFPALVLGVRDVPSGERWRALASTPIGALLVVPLLFSLIRYRRNEPRIWRRVLLAPISVYLFVFAALQAIVRGRDRRRRIEI